MRQSLSIAASQPQMLVQRTRVGGCTARRARKVCRMSACCCLQRRRAHSWLLAHLTKTRAEHRGLVAGVAWNEAEHKQFLAGLQKLGKVRYLSVCSAVQSSCQLGHTRITEPRLCTSTDRASTGCLPVSQPVAASQRQLCLYAG